MKRQPPDFSVIIIEFRMERVMMAVETRVVISFHLGFNNSRRTSI